MLHCNIERDRSRGIEVRIRVRAEELYARVLRPRLSRTCRKVARHREEATWGEVRRCELQGKGRTQGACERLRARHRTASIVCMVSVAVTCMPALVAGRAGFSVARCL